MKKNPIIFIAMLVALAFTSCQMNTDDSVVIPPTYKITVTATNGTVTLSKTEAKAGEKVFVESISPNEGYTTNGLEQTFQSKDGKTLTLDFGTEDGKRYFVMPECNVVITVTFKAATPAPTTEATSYKIVYGDETLKSGLTLAQVNDYINKVKLILTTDYSLDKVNGVLTLTESGLDKLNKYVADNGETETPTTDGGEDSNNGEPPATANEYTVSVASGIKGGHIEVSLDNATWTTLSTSTKYAKNTKLYVRAVADKHYEYKDGLRTDGFDGQLNYIMLNSNAELTANFVIKNESLTPGSLTFNGEKANLSNYRRLVMIDIKESDFSESYKNARLAFGFSDGFYSINKRIGSTSTDKYFYVYDTEINTFENVNNLKRIFVAINLDNSYELPDGKIYVLFPNLKNSDGKSVMYVAEESTSGTFVVNVDGANTNYSASEKYYFDASQL